MWQNWSSKLCRQKWGLLFFIWIFLFGDKSWVCKIQYQNKKTFSFQGKAIIIALNFSNPQRKMTHVVIFLFF
ncbi:hypothetical protein KKB_08756 [Kingella kingae PYKK081]|nr:hypothetical protein KKB_08756 [Kingella kingae PYKK081]